MAVEGESREQELPLFVPQAWDREKGGRFFHTSEGGDESLGKGNHPAPNRVPGAVPGVITSPASFLMNNSTSTVPASASMAVTAPPDVKVSPR